MLDKKMIKKLSIIVVSISIFLTNCGTEPSQTTQQSTRTQTDGTQSGGTQSGNQANQVIPTYNQDIKPIFDQFCVSCHRSGGSASAYLLDTYQNIMNGKTNCGAVPEKRYIVPSNADQSYLYKKIIGQGICGDKMPPSGSLSQDRIDLIKRWINAGAPESSAGLGTGDSRSGTGGGTSGGTSGSGTGGSGGGGSGGGKTPPAVFGQYIYTVSEDGKILRWKNGSAEVIFDLGENVRIVSPSIDNHGNLYFSAWNGFVYSVNTDGQVLWKIHFGKCDGVSIHNEKIAFGCSNGVFYELSKDGKILHSILVGAPIVSAPLVLEEGSFVFGSDNGNVYKVKDGKVLSTFKTEGQVRETPSIDKIGRIYFGSYDNYVYSLNSDFSLRWKYKTSGGIYSGCSIWERNGKTVCTIGSKDGYTYSIDEDGEIIWKVNTGEVSTVPLIGKKYIYVLNDQNVLLAISKDGQIVSSHQIEETYYSSPAIFSGKIIISTEHGEVVEFDFQDEILDGWTTARGNLRRTGELK